MVADLVFGWVWISIQKFGDSQNESRRAEATLNGAVEDERLL
jgi:hypothetical protein